jgi:hypothetical protein
MTTFYVLMPRWPLSLPPPAAPTLPTHSRRSSLSIAIESPSRHPSPSSWRCVVHHRQVAIAPFIVVHHHCARGPSPSHSCLSYSSIRRVTAKQSLAIYCRQAACIVLKRIWITNEDEIWIGHVVHSVLSGCLMGARWVWAQFWQSGWCQMTMIT